MARTNGGFQMTDKSESEEQTTNSKSRKVYKKPELTTYGNIQDSTFAQKGAGADSSNVTKYSGG
jgi:hypothetical protein